MVPLVLCLFGDKGSGQLKLMGRAIDFKMFFYHDRKGPIIEIIQFRGNEFESPQVYHASPPPSKHKIMIFWLLQFFPMLLGDIKKLCSEEIKIAYNLYVNVHLLVQLGDHLYTAVLTSLVLWKDGRRSQLNSSSADMWSRVANQSECHFEMTCIGFTLIFPC